MTKSKILRFLKDEPISQPEDVSVEEQQLTARTTPGTQVEDVVPVLDVEHVECVADGAYLNVSVQITNKSGEPVTLRETRLLGASKSMNELLNNGETKQLVVYTGKAADTEFSEEAELIYEAAGVQARRFLAHYQVKGGRGEDGQIMITAMELQLPIHEA